MGKRAYLEISETVSELKKLLSNDKKSNNRRKRNKKSPGSDITPPTNTVVKNNIPQITLPEPILKAQHTITRINTFVANASPKITIGGRTLEITPTDPIVIPTRINFSGNDGTFLSRNDNINNRTLNAIIRTLVDYPQIRLFMYVNHLTDIRAKETFNEERHLKIVSKRASALMRFFRDQGINTSRILWDYDPKKFEPANPDSGTIRDDQKLILKN